MNSSRPKSDKITLELTYHEIARRFLLHQSLADIAQVTGIKRVTLQAMTRRSAFKNIMEDLKTRAFAGVDQSIISEKRNLRVEIMQVAEDSFDRLKALLTTAASESIQVNIAQDFMDRAGYVKTPEVVPAPVININVVDAEILTSALEREKLGRERLEKLGTFELAKDAKALEHPLLKPRTDDGDKPDSQPAS